MPKKVPDRELGRKVRKFLRLDESVKVVYAEMDKIGEELMMSLIPGEPVQISRNSAVLLEDKFAGKWKVWKSTPMKRYEIKIVPV